MDRSYTHGEHGEYHGHQNRSKEFLLNPSYHLRWYLLKDKSWYPEKDTHLQEQAQILEEAASYLQKWFVYLLYHPYQYLLE